MIKFIKNLFIKKKDKNIIIEKETDILTHLNNDDTAIYATYKKRLIPFIYVTLISESKYSCTIFVKHIDNMILAGQDLEKLLVSMQRNSVYIEIITLEQNDMFIRMINKLNSQSPTKIQLYIGEFNGVGSFQNFIVTDGKRYMIEQPYPIDYDYSNEIVQANYSDYDYSNEIVQANYSMNNPLGCKWLIHLSQEYKKQILR